MSNAPEEFEYRATENERIRQRRMVAFGEGSENVSKDVPDNLVGLALSGGGIRSALFNDGFLQALSHHGFLRYVDYLCSVSGGGYIAGHLMTQSTAAGTIVDGQNGNEEASDFHNAPKPGAVGSDTFVPWHFGRHPTTGREDASRLPEIGAYLNRSLKFFAGYLFNQLPVVLLYLSLVGSIATLIALYYRSFDAPQFRETFVNVLGVRFGDELLIAFIPTIVIGCCCFIVAVGLALIALLWPSVSMNESLLLGKKWSLATLFLACMSSVAVFMGNSLTKATSNPAVELSTSFNHFAVQVTVIAAIAQILVFLGRDRLFQSGRSESPRWKKVVQSAVANGVVFFLFFTMVHLMARENISRYVQNRDPYLVRGEVVDWRFLEFLANSAGLPAEGQDCFWSPAEYAETRTTGQSRSLKNWKSDLEFNEYSNPKSPAELRDQKNKHLLNPLTRFGLVSWFCIFPENLWFRDINENVRNIRQRQTGLVDRINKEMEKKNFTDFLLQHLRNSSGKTAAPREVVKISLPLQFQFQVPAAGTSSTDGTLSILMASDSLKARIEALSNSQRQELELLLRHHDVGIMATSTDTDVPSLLERVSLNRTLLLLCGEGRSILGREDVASTPVVQPHDQNARWRWLNVWLVLLAFALLGTANLNRNSHLFDFYRQGIADNFLKSKKNFVSASTLLKNLAPHRSGLPFPIYLGTWLMPSLDAAAERLPLAVSMTPLATLLRGIKDTPNNEPDQPVSQSHLHVDEIGITLADAVAVSGAAVSPTMTSTSALTLLMDFFGVRLGLWFPTANSVSSGKWGLVIVSAIACFIVLLFESAFLQGTPFVTVAFFTIITAIAFFQGMTRIGYVQLAISLFKTAIQQGNKDTTRTTILECWPRAFVSDGGFYDYLGVTELLRRECDLIVVSDAGVNSGSTSLESLAILCERSTSELGIRIFDLDHDAPIAFARLEKDLHQRVPQPYMAMRIRYKSGKEGLLFYAEMAITENDPVEIQQIRHRFPSFPGEPTSNQFYTREQTAAYRDLGYHIGNRLCSHLQRWEVADFEKKKTDRGQCQPFFDEMLHRLTRGYLQTCYEEYYYSDDDVYGESIWSGVTCMLEYPSFNRIVREFRTRIPDCSGTETQTQIEDRIQKTMLSWFNVYSANKDVSSKYLEGINRDVNRLNLAKRRDKPETFKILEELLDPSIERKSEETCPAATAWEPSKKIFLDENASLIAAHFAVLAVSCQQLHRGTPHSVFQIGGREKLFDTVSNLVKELVKLCGRCIEGINPQHLPRLDADDFARSVIDEVAELRESVFQSADDLAVVSFIQCLCMQCAACWPEGNLEVKNPERKGPFRLSLDFRQLMIDSLQSGYRSRACDLISAYFSYLCRVNHTDLCEDNYEDQLPVELNRTLPFANSSSGPGRPR